MIDRVSDPSRTIHVRHNSNNGIAAARNSGLAAARGEFIALLDQDDLWLPRKLEEQLGMLKTRPDCGLCYARHVYFSAAGDHFFVDTVKYPEFHARVSEMDPSLVAGKLFMNNFIAAGSVMVRRQILMNAGGFDEDIRDGVDDYDLWLRLCRNVRFAFLDSIQLLSRSHSTNYTERMRSSDDTFAVLRKAEKNFDIPWQVARESREMYHYKRCRFRFLGGDYAGALSDLSKASMLSGPRVRYRVVEILIRLRKPGAILFGISRGISPFILRLFRPGGLNRRMKLSAGQFETFRNGGGAG